MIRSGEHAIWDAQLVLVHRATLIAELAEAARRAAEAFERSMRTMAEAVEAKAREWGPLIEQAVRFAREQGVEL